jgi:hypothetical protein
MPLHRDSTLENIHRHHRWEVNNQAGLDALVPDALDIHKVAYKKDDDTYHVLKSVSPTVWVQTAYTKASSHAWLFTSHLWCLCMFSSVLSLCNGIYAPFLI